MKALMTALLLFAGSEAAYGEAYLCVADASTGFSYDKARQRWEPTNFDIEGKRYSLSEKAGVWTWSKLGDRDEVSKCGKFTDYGHIFCESSFALHFAFNKRTLRFMAHYDVLTPIVGRDLINPDESNPDTPYIEIGSCSSI